MILAVRTKSSSLRGGFTLLEMMITIGLIALLAGAAFVSYKPDSPSERMKKASIEIEAFGARGHTMSILHQKPFWLRFERHRVVLQGAELERVNTAEVELERDHDALPLNEEEASLIIDYDTYEFPEEVEVFVRRWGAKESEWFHQEKKEDPVIFWNFEQTGLCEPISIRFEIGKSWVEIDMDPLTARISDERSEVYD